MTPPGKLPSSETASDRLDPSSRAARLARLRLALGEPRYAWQRDPAYLERLDELLQRRAPLDAARRVRLATILRGAR